MSTRINKPHTHTHIVTHIQSGLLVYGGVKEHFVIDGQSSWFFSIVEDEERFYGVVLKL